VNLAVQPSAPVAERLATLGATAGFEGPFDATPMRGGNNNQIYRVDTPHRVLVLKVYFSHRGDARDRLRHEFDFISYLWSAGVRSVPEPYAADPDSNLALYEFVAGDTVNSKGVTLDDVEAAVAFYRAINTSKESAAAASLAPASEAAFAIADHVSTVNTRIARLEHIVGTSDIDAAARQFVSTEIVPLWKEIRRGVCEASKRHGRFGDVLSPSLRCLSPSDFGFHNAIAEASGRIRFVDFEYAGWDDPAKLVCDFGNQPDNLLPPDFSDRFRRALIDGSAEPESLCDRIAWLTPVYQTKWACIVLNIFLDTGQHRHRFVTGEQETADRKQQQLGKARVMLDRARLASVDLRR